MLKLACLVDVEGEITLKLDDFPFCNLHLLEVRLSLVLKSRIRLHEVIIELYKLFHLRKSIFGHFALITHFSCLLLTVCFFVTVDESLIFAHQKLDSLLISDFIPHRGFFDLISFVLERQKVGLNKV